MKINQRIIQLTVMVSVLVLAGCGAPAISDTEGSVEKTLPPVITPEQVTPEPSVPTLIISPTSGLPGTVVQVYASGFQPNAHIVIAFGPINSELGIVGEGTTDVNGGFNLQIPVQGAPGMQLAFAAVVDDQPGVLSTEPFQILNSSQPQVVIYPAGGVSGTMVQVIASGFPANKPAIIGLGPANSGFGTVAEGTTDSNGFFSAQVPVVGEPGTRWVFSVSVDSQPGINANETFQVLIAPPNPGPNDPTPTPYMDTWSTFTNTYFSVSLQYPSDWQPMPGYGSSETGDIRYEGVTGFFLVNAMDTDTIDLAADAEAGHVLMPYGANPTVESLVVQGQEARLVLPSSDQPGGMSNQAALIVTYPTADGETRFPRFFVLYADAAHIRTIAETIRFIDSP